VIEFIESSRRGVCSAAARGQARTDQDGGDP
jgi:hypothetical protein